MRNPALLAASLAGKPLLMDPREVAQYARLLGAAADQGGDNGLGRKSGFGTLLARARRVLAGDPAPQPEGAALDGERRVSPEVCLPIWMDEPEDEGFGWCLVGTIAVIDVRGPLMAEGFYSDWADVWCHGYDTLYAATEEALGDARVKALFIRYKTPGGVCAPGLGEWARLMRENRASAGGKPIWGFANYAYSAGYWAISQSDQVLAAREGGVGSIGAVITHCDVSGALSKEGFVVEHFKFGAKKTDGSPFEPLSDTAKADIQAEVDQAGRWFVADVVAGRPTLTAEAVLATQAGIFYGDSDVEALSGLANGLVDRVMSEREAFAALQDLAASRLNPAAQVSPGLAAPASNMEYDMKRSQVRAGLQAAGLSAEDLEKVDAHLVKAAADDGEGDYDDEEEEDEELGEEGGPPKPGAAAPGPAAAAAAPAAPDAATALAITGLPEAKGREALARALAATPGMTLDSAKAALAAAPKAAINRPQDHQVSASAAAAPQGEFAEGQALAARFKAMQPGARRDKR